MDLNNPRKVKKDKLRVMIITQDYKIEGDVHIFPTGRLTDFINSREDGDFIATTDVEIISMHHTIEPLKVNYLALNKNDIIMVYPLN